MDTQQKVARAVFGVALPLLLALALALFAAGASATEPPVQRAGADGVVAGPAQQTDTLVIVTTGDGGWWGDFDVKVTAAFEARGDAVVGIDTAIYFADERTPDA